MRIPLDQFKCGLGMTTAVRCPTVRTMRSSPSQRRKRLKSSRAWNSDEAVAPTKLAAAAGRNDPYLCADCNDRLDNDASIAVFVLIEAKKFDATQQAFHEVLARFPGFA